MSRRLALLVLAALASGLAACASTEETSGQSNIPWNRPQSWEGPGVYGSAINQR